ncbi:MAG: methionyl-tRNA formyltransferase [Deltaproteobacteria bacterium]|nr:methionyl-tRNA formyltransferase [Deltaproteobacteria bacterium]
MGTPAFSVPALQALIEADYPVVAVVTQPDRPKGRGRKLAPPPVKELAFRYDLEVLQPEKASSEPFCELIRQKSPDLLVVVAFGQILKKSLLDIPTWGALNIHASLLPKYRGAAPIQWAILNRESRTGLTAMKMDEGLDTGPIICQEEVPIEPNESAGHLHDRLSLLAGPFLMKTLRRMAQGEVSLQRQDDSSASYAPKIDKGMSRIDWNAPAADIAAKIRAFDPWPGAYSHIKERQTKIFSAMALEQHDLAQAPGTVTSMDTNGLIVQAKEGSVKIGEMQLPGKRKLPVHELVKGFAITIGDRFE